MARYLQQTVDLSAFDEQLDAVQVWKEDNRWFAEVVIGEFTVRANDSSRARAIAALIAMIEF